MARRKSSFGIIKEFNKSEVLSILDNIKIYSNDNSNIITTYNDKEISNCLVSDKYEIFDFPKFSKMFLIEMQKYFQPETYSLNICRGVQSLTFYGESVIINNQNFKKFISIINSTDKSRALQIVVGLKNVAFNISVVASYDDTSYIRSKHYKTTMPERIKLFINDLTKFDIDINQQIKLLNDMINKTVSYKDMITKLSYTKDGKITSTVSMRVKNFARNIFLSKYLKDLSPEQISLLRNSHTLINNLENVNNIDIVLPLYESFILYMDSFKNFDASVFSRESKRFLLAIE
jgi:hypothetical protein